MSSLLRQVQDWQRVSAGATAADGELLRRFLHQGDEAAFELLVYRHGNMVLSLCRRLLRDDHAAEDAFQATFLVLACKARSVVKQGSLGSWLYKVAVRVAQRQRSKVRSNASLDRAGQQSVGSGCPVAVAAQREVGWIVAEEIDRLAERFRRTVVLCCLEGKSSSEAARELGCSVNTVATRLLRARQRLKQQLSRRGLGWPAGGIAGALGGAELATADLTPLAAPLAAQAVVALKQGLGHVALATSIITLSKGAAVTMAWQKAKLALVGVLVAGLGTLTLWQAGAGQHLGQGEEAAWLLRVQEHQANHPHYVISGGSIVVNGAGSLTVSAPKDLYQDLAALPPEVRRLVESQKEEEEEILAEAQRRIKEKRISLYRKLNRAFSEIRQNGDLDQAVAVRDLIRQLEYSAFEVQQDPGNLSAVQGRLGSSQVFAVTGAVSGSVWGAGTYTDDSALATAAVHAGVLKPGERGLVRVTLKPGRESYEGSERNGVTTMKYGPFRRSYTVERARMEERD